jgi:hypothetical protein
MCSWGGGSQSCSLFYTTCCVYSTFVVCMVPFMVCVVPIMAMSCQHQAVRRFSRTRVLCKLMAASASVQHQRASLLCLLFAMLVCVWNYFANLCQRHPLCGLPRQGCATDVHALTGKV